MHATSDARRRVWFERLNRRLHLQEALRDVRVRDLGHELLLIQARAGGYSKLDDDERQTELERVLRELGERVGVGPPPR